MSETKAQYLSSNNQKELPQITNAKKFISSLLDLLNQPSRVLMPLSCCSAKNKEISFYWKKENGFVFDLSFYDDGSRSYYAKIPGRENVIEFIVDKENGDDPLPNEIINEIVEY